MTGNLYHYRVLRVLRVVDGDTLDLELDLGFSLRLKQRVRLVGVDAAETRTLDLAEKERGLSAKAFVAEWVERNAPLIARTSKDDKYGRMLADLIAPDGTSLCSLLLSTGFAESYTP